jgi:hypothetical protein
MVSRYPILASGLNGKDATGRVLRNTALGITERLPRAMRKKRVRGAHLNAVRPQNSCESYRAESALAKNIVLIVVCWRGLDTVRFPSDFFLIASFTTTARNS